MEILNLSDNPALNRKNDGFWMRQFQPEATVKQRKFDMAFGVVLPVICFMFDPVVFSSGIFGAGSALLGNYKPFGYVLSYMSVMGMLAFLLMGKKLKWANGFLSGLFFLSSAISLGIGILMLRHTLIGLLVLIGFLGFTPFISSFVYLRNAVRSYETASLSMDIKVLKHIAALSFILSFCVPYVFNAQVGWGLRKMRAGDAQTVRKMGARFRYIAPFVNFDPLVQENMSSSIDPKKRKALAEVYLELTGKDIEAARGFD